MIEITKAYKTEDGLTFATIIEAQQHELARILSADDSGTSTVNEVIANAEKVIAILKLKPRKPRTVKAKKQKTVKTLEQSAAKTLVMPNQPEP